MHRPLPGSVTLTRWLRWPLVARSPLLAAAGSARSPRRRPKQQPAPGAAGNADPARRSGGLPGRPLGAVGSGCGTARALKGPGPFMGSRAIAVSPDGKNVYVASSKSDAIAIFRRNARRPAR